MHRLFSQVSAKVFQWFHINIYKAFVTERNSDQEAVDKESEKRKSSKPFVEMVQSSLLHLFQYGLAVIDANEDGKTINIWFSSNSGKNGRSVPAWFNILGTRMLVEPPTCKQ